MNIVCGPKSRHLVDLERHLRAAKKTKLKSVFLYLSSLMLPRRRNTGSTLTCLVSLDLFFDTMTFGPSRTRKLAIFRFLIHLKPNGSELVSAIGYPRVDSVRVDPPQQNIVCKILIL